MSSVFKNVKVQMQNALRFCKIHPNTQKVLATPQNRILFSFPVQLSKGMDVLQGYRVQHNNWLGPYKGGLRFHPRCEFGRSGCVGVLDDVQMRIARFAIWRSKGGTGHRPFQIQQRRYGRYCASIHAWIV